MQLTSIMKESLVFPEIGAKSKEQALRFLTDRIADEFTDLDREELYNVILERERLSSTGIGSGIAIPHAKLSHGKHHVAVFGRSGQGIPFEAIDGKPVHLIFLIVGPVGANEAHLKALARISKFLHDTAFRDQLFRAHDAREIFQSIADKDAQY